MCAISVQICNLKIGHLSHLNDFHVFIRDNIRKPFTLCITQSLNIQIHSHLLYRLASFCIYMANKSGVAFSLFLSI